MSHMKKHASLGVGLLIVLSTGSAARADSSPVLSKSIEAMAKVVCAKAPSKNGILVLDLQNFDGSVSYFNRYITDQLTITLSNKPNVTVVDRQVLKTILSEKKIQEAGLVEEATAISIGKMVGAKTAVYGTIADSPKVLGINIKVINIEKGTVVGGIVKEIRKNSAIVSLLDGINEQEARGASAGESAPRVVEIQMEEAIKERMKTQDALSDASGTDVLPGVPLRPGTPLPGRVASGWNDAGCMGNAAALGGHGVISDRELKKR